MSITRTARLATSDSASSNTVAGSVTAATGSSLIVMIANAGSRTVSSISWTGGSFSKDQGVTNGTTNGEIWSAHNVTGGTNTLTVTLSGNTTIKILIVSELIPTNGPLTTGNKATGTGSTNPAITTTSPTGTPNSGGQVAWIGQIGVQRNNTDAAPTWSVPTTAGQKTGLTTAYMAEGYEIDSTTKTQALSATMATAANYGAVMVNYIEPAAAPIFSSRNVSQAVKRASFY